MILYKIIGSASIFLSAMIFAIQSQQYEKMKIKQAEAFIILIKFIKKQIDCFCLPIYEIISKSDQTVLKNCGFKYCDINNMPIDSSFEWILNNCWLYIDQEAIELIKKFSSELGKSYREDQLKSCDYYASELMEYKNRLISDLPKKRKIKTALCVCSSLSFILLMI